MPARPVASTVNLSSNSAFLWHNYLVVEIFNVSFGKCVWIMYWCTPSINVAVVFAFVHFFFSNEVFVWVCCRFAYSEVRDFTKCISSFGYSLKIDFHISGRCSINSSNTINGCCISCNFYIIFKFTTFVISKALTRWHCYILIAGKRYACGQVDFAEGNFFIGYTTIA